MSDRKKVLLIDDDRDHLGICELVLQRRGYEVLTLLDCSDREEVMRVTQSFLPDLIFIDHNMQGICGIDVAKMLGSEPALRQVPVIYFSAEDNIAELAREAGAVNYLKKPFQIEHFLRLAGDYIGS